MPNKPYKNVIPKNYEELMYLVEGLSLAKVTNSVGDGVEKNHAKKMLVAVTTLLELYRNANPNHSAEKIIISRISGS